MSKKHFIALAKELNKTMPDKQDKFAYSQWEKDCEAIARVCNMANNNFNWNRFLGACRGD